MQILHSAFKLLNLPIMSHFLQFKALYIGYFSLLILLIAVHSIVLYGGQLINLTARLLALSIILDN